MTSVTSKHRIRQLALSVAGIVFFYSYSTATAQPHADVPLDPVEFSIDFASPTIVTGGVTQADILKKPGPTAIAISVSMGFTPLDELDGLSADEGEFLPGVPFVILFSVSRASTGLAAPDPSLVAQNRPFNVLNQAALNQAPGDVFMTTREFDAGGLVPDTGGGRSFSLNNTLVLNQGDTGGVDMDLSPNKAPSKTELSGTMKDGVDAIRKASSASSGAASIGSGGGGQPRGPTGPGPGGDPTVVDPVFFSLRRGSPGLMDLPGPPSPANIYFDPSPEQPGTETIFLAVDQLGLQFQPGALNDDISGFTVFLGGPGRGVTGPIVLFTLSPGSPSLGSSFSPADIFVSPGDGTFSRFASAEQLGLATTDAITGFTILKSTNVDQLVLDSAIQRRIPGDHDGDGQLTDLDCAGFVDCYSGDGMTYDTNGVTTYSVNVGPGAVFDPASISIEIGDTVEWTWVDGPHNVVSGTAGVPDGAFNSGPPTSVAGTTFNVVFDEAFVNAHPKVNYPYYSEPDLSTGMTGNIQIAAHPCATYDQDYDGDVDCDDWHAFQALYVQLNGSICVPLTIPEFVAVLLDQPMHPSHPCIADLNDDGLNNGLDIHLYVQYLLNS